MGKTFSEKFCRSASINLHDAAHFHSKPENNSVTKFVIIIQLANLTVTHALGTYYQHAAHRVSLPALAEESAASQNRPLHFFRGMLHFEPSVVYLDTLKRSGFDPRVFRFPSDGEKNLLSQWRENTGNVVKHFLAHPDAIGERPVFCGHSAGGLTVYSLAALAKGGNLRAIREECPGLESVSMEALQHLRDAFLGALFVSIASPLHGVKLTRIGRCVNRFLIEPRSPLLFSGITQANLESYYRRVGLRPEAAIDANLVSSYGEPSYHGGSLSKVSSLVIQSGMRVFSPFLDHEAENDGIVPRDAALLNGPVQAFAPFDHLKLVEMPEAALTLVDLIRQADPIKQKLS